MSSGYTFLLAILAVMIMCVAVSAASRRPGPTWHYYHFDGQGFATCAMAGRLRTRKLIHDVRQDQAV